MSCRISTMHWLGANVLASDGSFSIILWLCMRLFINFEDGSSAQRRLGVYVLYLLKFHREFGMHFKEMGSHFSTNERVMVS